MELKYVILEKVIFVFNDKGIKFTMDDLAKQLSMSKKTIYAMFPDKKTLLMEMADYMFDNIKASENKILEDNSLDLVEKIQKILTVLPDGYAEVDFTKMFALKEKYPQVFRRVEERLEIGWEPTIDLLEKGMREGTIRKINIPVLKVIIESTIAGFLKSDMLSRNKIPYKDALEELNKIIMMGIRVQGI